MRSRLLVLALLAALAAGIGVVSIRSVRAQLAALEACQAAGSGDWEAALAASESGVGSDETGRSAAECRCLALLATGNGEACVAMLETLLAEPDAEGWAPRPELSIHLVQTWRERGLAREAAALAMRAARAWPTDPQLFYLELLTRSSVGDEEAVLRELAARIDPSWHSAPRMRVSLAQRYLLRGDAPSALASLGETPPEGAAAGRWFDVRGLALARAGDLPAVRKNAERWRTAADRDDEVRARTALALSLAGLSDPDEPPLEMLADALVAAQGLDRALREALTIRLILTLVNAGRHAEAIAAYDRGRAEFELEGLTRAELERSASHLELQSLSAEERRGTLYFEVALAQPGAMLWLSPDLSAPVDTAYEALAFDAAGSAVAERAAGVAPQRWVYRDAGGAVRASGTVSPQPGRIVRVEVRPGPARGSAPASITRRAGDGRRRVVLLLLDCADWRIAGYLRARGELPVFAALLESGHRAVLDSNPPLTAAALEALVWPGRRSGASVVGLVRQLGVELAGLSSVGDNPFDALDWVLPEDEDLFGAIGAGPRSAANLLFAHGGMRAGRHSEVTGPDGLRRRIRLESAARDLRADEREAWPELARQLPERDAVHVRTIAAEFDAAEDIVRAGEVDLLALRIEPLDILTHAHFARAVRDGQDDGRGLLFEVYRYIDARVGGVARQLDEDDVLIVMSDHGIRTAMDHSRDAIFSMTGAGVPSGRAAGRPALRGVPQVLARLLDLEAGWPDTGVAPFANAFAAR